MTVTITDLLKIRIREYKEMIAFYEQRLAIYEAELREREQA